MKVTITRQQCLSVALTFAALVLSAVLLWEWDQWRRLQENLLTLRSIPIVAAKPLEILPEFVLPTAETGFPELISRSLFAVNRRSSAVASNAGTPSMKKGQYVLVGVLITPQRSSVQLRDVQTNKALTVAMNESVRGMTVSEVRPASVVLRQGAESEELNLNVQPGPQGAIVERAPAPLVAAPTASTPVPAAPAPNGRVVIPSM